MTAAFRSFPKADYERTIRKVMGGGEKEKYKRKNAKKGDWKTNANAEKKRRNKFLQSELHRLTNCTRFKGTSAATSRYRSFLGPGGILIHLRSEFAE